MTSVCSFVVCKMIINCIKVTKRYNFFFKILTKLQKRCIFKALKQKTYIKVISVFGVGNEYISGSKYSFV